jgi:hypothetical protein
MAETVGSERDGMCYRCAFSALGKAGRIKHCVGVWASQFWDAMRLWLRYQSCITMDYEILTFNEEDIYSVGSSGHCFPQAAASR